MPSAERCIWEWKREIFVTNNSALSDSVGELSLPGTRRRLQKWFDQRGDYPPLGSPDEYSFYARECYRTNQDRRSFFQSFAAKASPHIGYQLLPLLAKAGIIRSVWTTNFDGLVARAASAANVIPVEIGIDSTHRAFRAPCDGELRVVSLHGDFRYDDLKNTDEELQEQEANLKTALLHELVDHDLVVSGYSGRDESLVSVLMQAYKESGSSRLFWCGFGETIPPVVTQIIQQARQAGREAFYVSTEGFDDLITRLSLRRLEGAELDQCRTLLSKTEDSSRKPAPFTLPNREATSLFKSNAYPLTHPRELLKLDVSFPSGVNGNQWLRERLEGYDTAFVRFGDGFLSVASPEDLAKALGASLRTSPVAMAISDDEVYEDGRIQSLIRRALVISIAKCFSTSCDNSRSIWEPTAYKKEKHENTNYDLHRALSFRLEFHAGGLHVVLVPEVVVLTADGHFAEKEVKKILRNAVYGYQHNDVFDNDIKRWTERITDVDIPCFGGGTFKIGRAPIYTGLVQKGKPLLPEKYRRHIKQSGVILQDADLVFCARNGKSEAKAPNPLAGLIANRPWDFQLTASGLTPNTEVACICPARDATKLSRFLARLNERAQPIKTEKDYLQDFPGYTSAFGLPLVTALPGDPAWVQLDDEVGANGLGSAKLLATRICKSLDLIRGIRPSAVVVIFVPSSWEPHKIIETESESFNLHDYVKAYAARQGQSTQFLREETTATMQPCRVSWWLALALYTKGLRTPWRMDCLDDETAFVGIGYSIDTVANRGNHILLGCSHLYSSRGEGLQFRLGRIENPIIRNKNPFMSEDDARRTGETVRQLFYDARMRLPSRVVIYKKTPFIEDEKRGLVAGLEGVANLEMIQVTFTDSLRYLSSQLRNGELQIDKFPVPRGTVVLQDSLTACLWVHGSTPSVQNPRYRYYQGKRRIPAPLYIRRFQGRSDIVQVGTEILALSKMNWNSFDYYSRLPATLDSASAIARMGVYLGGFSSAPYDYRLLI